MKAHEIEWLYADSPLEFQISLCEDLDELLEAFFRDFSADGVEQPHKLFTGSWRLPTAAQYLGLSPESLDGSVNSYVLVKLVRNKGTKTATGNIKLDNEAAEAAGHVQVGDQEALLKFVKHYGTHYFKSVTVGDAVYQVSFLFTLGQKYSINPKIHISKTSFLTKFTFSKPRFSQNSHFSNIKFYGILR